MKVQMSVDERQADFDYLKWFASLAWREGFEKFHRRWSRLALLLKRRETQRSRDECVGG